MRFLAKLVTGEVALWCTFWLIGLPLSLLWDASGACMVFGCGIGQPLIVGSFIGLFALSSIAVVIVSIAIWRSSSKYPREAWWQSLLAILAKLSAAVAGLAAALSLLAGSYLIFIFIRATFADG